RLTLARPSVVGWPCWSHHALSADAGSDLRPPQPVILFRGLPASVGSLRRFQADSRAGSTRDEKKPAVVMSNTCTDLQDFDGSDGTRTRDLRRDRPGQVVSGPSGDRRACPSRAGLSIARVAGSAAAGGFFRWPPAG